MSHRIDGIRYPFRISRAIREEDPVGVHGQSGGRGCRGRNDRHVTTVIHQAPQNIVLDSEIEGHDLEAGARRRRGRIWADLPLLAAIGPSIGAGARHLLDEIPADNTWRLSGLLHHPGRIQLQMGNAPLLGSLVPKVRRKRTGIDPLDTGNAVRFQILVEGQAGAPLWAVGPGVAPFVAARPGKAPFELATAFQQAIDAGERVAGIEIGPTRGLTTPFDLLEENVPYLRHL